jgi:ATP-dependent Clp protease adaptor protein ClpS
MRGAKILTPKRRDIDRVAVDLRATDAGVPFLSGRLRGAFEKSVSIREGTSATAIFPAIAELPDETHYSGPAWIHADAKPGTQTSPDIDVEEKLKEAFARGWSVIVWNDPVNLMDYVVYVFKTVLKMNEKDASRHMWEVHQNGKSMVARETREKSELIVHRLRGFGLNATLEQES